MTVFDVIYSKGVYFVVTEALILEAAPFKNPYYFCCALQWLLLARIYYRFCSV